jgi:hypothetical protein
MVQPQAFVLGLAVLGLAWVVIEIAVTDPGMFIEIWDDSAAFAAARTARGRRWPAPAGSAQVRRGRQA